MDANYVIEIGMGLFALWGGSLEYRMRYMKKDTAELIDLKTESTKAVQERISKDVERLELKIDDLIKMLLKFNPGESK